VIVCQATINVVRVMQSMIWLSNTSDWLRSVLPMTPRLIIRVVGRGWDLKKDAHWHLERGEHPDVKGEPLDFAAHGYAAGADQHEGTCPGGSNWPAAVRRWAFDTMLVVCAEGGGVNSPKLTRPFRVQE